MDLHKNVIQIDPDYESNNSAIRNVKLKEEEEEKLTEEKLREIIQEEFDKELIMRQNQIKEIEEKIFKAQKLLHIVRYVLISSYYNNKALEYNTTTEETGLEATNILIGQNQIHPALKKLLGNNYTNLQYLTSHGKRKTHNKKAFNTKSPLEEQPLNKKMKIEQEESSSSSSDLYSKPVAPDRSEDNDSIILTNRKKMEHRIIVGNISYYKKSLEQDNLTHKWMVYVRIYRGPKTGPDISNIIRRVVFHLHPSYKPHDVVEVSEPPFHLSRRGWGEFPVRVQIVFKSSFNKPVDIIHNLKLDKTFVGRQTVGNETVVPIFLHDENALKKEIGLNGENTYKPTKVEKNGLEDKIHENDLTSDQEDVILNNITYSYKGKDDFMQLDSSNFEHDYCFDECDIKIEYGVETEEHDIEEDATFEKYEAAAGKYEATFLDHSYSLPCKKENVSDNHCLSKSNENQNYLNDQPETSLIFGLGDSYLVADERHKDIRKVLKEEPSNYYHQNKYSPQKILTTSSGRSIRFLPQSFSKVLLSNGSIVQVKLIQQPQSVLKKIDTQPPQNIQQNRVVVKEKIPDCEQDNGRKIDYEKYKLKFPKNKFKNMGETLPFFFKRLPLWSKLAVDSEFKCTYPFVARSEEEFRSWNIGKQLSCEWSRAKTIKKLLLNEHYCEKWNTKAIFMYGRSHSYAPFSNLYRMYREESYERGLLMSCFSNTNIKKYSVNNCSKDSDIYVDIESENDLLPSESTDCIMDVSDAKLINECSYIKEVALNCGIVLKPELIYDGVKMNAAERLILEAVKCFTEGLIRRSMHYMVCQKDYNEKTAEITIENVCKALNERSEFKAITNCQKQRRELEFFF